MAGSISHLEDLGFVITPIKRTISLPLSPII